MNNSINERVEREKIAHTEIDILGNSYKLKNKYSHIYNYPSRKKIKEYIASIHISEKVILDYGCGRGEESLNYLLRGAKKVNGIDISENYIEQANSLLLKHGFNYNQFDFKVMDAHKLEFEANSFDYVIGNGILHHLDYQTAMNEIYRVLKPNGRVLLFEPLLDNPLLKVFRFLTPNARTEDELPFSKSMINNIIKSKNWEDETLYCGIIEAPVAMITSILYPNTIDNFLLSSAHKIENFLNKKRILPSWNQYILFNLQKSC